jgi:hypothetical protein
MMNQHTPSQLSAIISALGGPSIQVEDIEWAIDLPAGKKLVDWIAAQLLDDEIKDGEGAYQAALHNIALEAGEVDMCVLLSLGIVMHRLTAAKAESCRTA